MTTRPDIPSSGKGLPAGSRIAIVAGSGSLPADVAERLDQLGHKPFLIIIRGEADRLERLQRFEHVSIPLEHGDLILPELRAKDIHHLVLAGGIARRPNLWKVRLSWHAIRQLPKLIPAMGRGDDALLRKFIDYVESYGIEIHAPHHIVPGLLAGRGILTRTRPTKTDLRDIAAAFAAARAIGALDIGQGAIAIGGRTVALEGVEGTDGLLARLPELRLNGRLANKKRGVLVKCAKPGQELRVDLPAIGVNTILDAKRGGLAGIGLQAGRSLILDHDDTLRAADENDVFIVGLSEAGEL